MDNKKIIKQKKRNKAYFLQKVYLPTIGAGIAALGFISYVILYMLLWLPIGYFTFIPLVVVGGALFIIGGTISVKDEEIKGQIDKAAVGYDSKIKEDQKYENFILKHPEDFETETYIFDLENCCYSKKTKKGKTVSNIFVKSHIFFANKELIVTSRKIELFELDGSENGGITDTFLSLPYSDISFVQLSESNVDIILSNTKQQKRIKKTELIITNKNGEKISLPVGNDVGVQNVCDEIMRISEKSKK